MASAVPEVDCSTATENISTPNAKQSQKKTKNIAIPKPKSQQKQKAAGNSMKGLQEEVHQLKRISAKVATAKMAAAKAETLSAIRGEDRALVLAGRVVNTLEAKRGQDRKRELLARQRAPGRQTDPRAVEFLRGNHLYREAWRLHGAPRDWPAPHPIMKADVTGSKYMPVWNRTANAAVSVPAGSALLLTLHPHERYFPLRGMLSTIGAGAAYATATGTGQVNYQVHSQAAIMASYDVGTTQSVQDVMGTSTCADWIKHAPWTYYDDDTAYNAFVSSNASTGYFSATALDDGVKFTPLIQTMMNTIEASVAPTYQASANVWVLSEGECPNELGRGCSSARIPVSAAAGIQDPFVGQIPYGSIFSNQGASNSFAQVVKQYGSLYPLAGNTSTQFRVQGAPDQTWFSAGAGNPAYNHRGRNNLLGAASYGVILIEASGAAVNVTFNAKVFQAVRIDQDDDVLALSPLAMALRQAAPSIVQSPPQQNQSIPLPHQSGSTGQGINGHFTQLMRDRGMPAVPVMPHSAPGSGPGTSTGVVGQALEGVGFNVVAGKVLGSPQGRAFSQSIGEKLSPYVGESTVNTIGSWGRSFLGIAEAGVEDAVEMAAFV